MRFVKSGREVDGWVSRPIETYYNPVTCELFERRMIGGQWIVFGSSIPVNSRALDFGRDKILHNQRLEDSREVRGALSQIMCGVTKDILPIIEYYLVACYPERLIPATVKDLKGWLPDCDFTN